MRTAVVGVVASALAALACAPAHALDLKPCGGSAKGFSCGTLDVPLDRTGALPGTIALRVAVQSSPAQRRKPLLIALSGGPGQGSVRYAASFAGSLKPALERYRLAVIDQRGTGGSGVLRCPVLQREGSLAPVLASELAACAASIGPSRVRYTTRDTVEDLDALRAALAQPKVALMGVSYGTYVAQQYARIHPDRTRALILDSVVGADGIDAFLLDTYARLPRILREQCANRRCAGVTDDPVGDLRAVDAAVRATGLPGPVYDARGRRSTKRILSGGELFSLVSSADLNPYLQAALPAAIRAARRGDPAPLLRLRPIADGGPTPLADLSAALNVTTLCQESALPYPLTASFADRLTLTAAALAAIPAAQLGPFSRETVGETTLAEDCSQWPADLPQPPSTDPLPDVPALLLDGRLDMRTPVESAEAVAAELPRASLVRVPGTGHDTLDSDITGCTVVALRRFVRGQAVGQPCRGTTNAVPVAPPPPMTLRAFVRAPGVAGTRGRVVFAVLDTLVDAQIAAIQRQFAGLTPRGGGLRGGRYVVGERLRVVRYAYVPGLRVTGSVDPQTLRGTVRFSGVATGRLTIHGTRLSGVVDGRPFRTRDRAATAARVDGRAPRMAVRARAPRRLHQLVAGRP